MSNLFKVHKLSDHDLEAAKNIGENFERLHDDLMAVIGQASPLTTIMGRKLEEACFYAKKAFAENCDK